MKMSMLRDFFYAVTHVETHFTHVETPKKVLRPILEVYRPIFRVLRPNLKVLRQGLCVLRKEVVRSNNRYVSPFDVLQALIVLGENYPLFIQLRFGQQVC